MKGKLKKQIPNSLALFIVVVSVVSICFLFQRYHKYSVTSKNNGLVSKLQLLCHDKQDWRRCYGEQLGVLNKNQSLTDTLNLLTMLGDVDKKTLDCHLISHKIAASEIEKNPQDWLSVFKIVNQDMCMGGFIHGTIEGKKRFDNSFEINEVTIPKICRTIKEATGREQYDACPHVMGHILLAEVQGDLKKGSEICNKLPDPFKAACNNGVFMEDITRDNLVDHGIARHINFDEASAKRIEDTCKQYSGVSGTSCWRELSHLYAELAKNNLEKAWELCSRASGVNNRDECYLHSFNSILPNVNFDEAQLSTICMPLKFDSKKYDRCYSWAIYDFLHTSIVINKKAITLCSLATEDYKKNCFSILGQRLSAISSLSDRQNFCRDVSGEYKDLCTCSGCTANNSLR